MEEYMVNPSLFFLNFSFYIRYSCNLSPICANFCTKILALVITFYIFVQHFNNANFLNLTKWRLC